MTCGADGGRSSSSCGRAPSASSLRSASRMLERSRPVALRVKVNPSTWSGRTTSSATRYATRAAMQVVFPEPAPATITDGSTGEDTAAHCSSVSSKPMTEFIWLFDRVME